MREESIGSSTRIEGAKLSNSNVAALLSKITLLNPDEQEVAGYAYVCQQVWDHFPSIPLTENYIKQLHLWLLQYVDKNDRHRGEYKKIPIHIEAFNNEGKTLRVIKINEPMSKPRP